MSKPKVYMDSTCFIDMAKQAVGVLPKERDKNIWFCKKLLEAHRDGNLEISTAILTVAECQHADNICDDQVQRLFKSILTSGQFVSLVQDTILVAERARDLRWIHKLSFKGADAIHLASALEIHCVEFITMDFDHFLSRAQEIAKLGIHVIPPHKTTQLPEEYLAGLLPGISIHAKGEIKKEKIIEIGNKENTPKAISGTIDPSTDEG